jgi:Fur family ferric uptake transcriptional regulator
MDGDHLLGCPRGLDHELPSPPARRGVPAWPVDASCDGQDPTARLLRAAGLTVTVPRRAVYAVLASRDRPATAAEVSELLDARGFRVGMTSIYRALHAFVRVGIAHRFTGEEWRFRICSASPHAHLVCDACGRVIERPAEVVRGWLAPAHDDADFVVNAERSDVYGVCGRCRPGLGSRE